MDPPRTRAQRRADARAKAKELMRREGAGVRLAVRAGIVVRAVSCAPRIGWTRSSITTRTPAGGSVSENLVEERQPKRRFGRHQGRGQAQIPRREIRYVVGHAPLIVAEVDKGQKVLTEKAMSLDLDPASHCCRLHAHSCAPKCDPRALVDALRKHGYIVTGPFSRQCFAIAFALPLVPRR